MPNFYNNVNFNQNELRNARIQMLPNNPSSPVVGQIWYNTTTNRLMYRDNVGNVDITDANTFKGNTPGYYLSRANHTGTQPQNTIDNLTADLSAKAPLSSPVFSGTPTTPNIGTPTTASAQIANAQFVQDAITAKLAANDYQKIKGGIDCSTNPNYPAANAGDTYRVTVGGKIGGTAGAVVEVGDTLICFTNNSVAGTQAAVGANWIVIQTNIDGALTTTHIGSTVQAYNSKLQSIALSGATEDDLLILSGTSFVPIQPSSLKVKQALVKGDVGLGQVDNTSDATKNAAAVTLTNKTISAASNTITGIGAANIANGLITGLTAETIIAGDDYVMIYDTSAGALRKISRTDFVAGLLGGGGTVQKYSQLIGNGSLSTFSITQATHGRAADSNNQVTIMDAATGEVVYPDVTVAPQNGTVTITFSFAPTSNQFRVLILG